MAVSEKSISNRIEKSSLAEELKKEREVIDTGFDSQRSHKVDLENLLNLAENLKDECDKAKNRIKAYRIFQITSIISMLVGTYFGVFYFFKDYATSKYVALFIGLFSLILTVSCYQLLIINDIKKQYLADKLALSEVLQLLRETSDIIAEQEYWSVLSRAEFRIRLSRFNLEEKSKSALNFLT